MSIYYKFLSEEFSDLWISRTRELYDHAIETGQYKELHMKYIITPTHMREYYIEKSPWLDDLPLYNPREHSVVFFRFNGSDPEVNHFEVHKDPTEAWANLNVPVYNCTKETRTVWVEPIGEEYSQHEERAGSHIISGQTNSEHLRSSYKEVETMHITDRACLFKGDEWHKVEVDHDRDEWRVMAKYWSRENDWDDLIKKYSEHIDEEYSIHTT